MFLPCTNKQWAGSTRNISDVVSDQRTGATSWRSLSVRQHAWDPSRGERKGKKVRGPNPLDERVHLQQPWKSRSLNTLHPFPVSLPQLFKCRSGWFKAEWCIRELESLSLGFIWRLLNVIRSCGFPLCSNICPGNGFFLFSKVNSAAAALPDTTTTLRLISHHGTHLSLRAKFAFSLLRHTHTPSQELPHFLCSHSYLPPSYENMW